MSHMRSRRPSMLSSWKAEQGMELGMRAMASTSSTLHTSILLYTYLHIPAPLPQCRPRVRRRFRQNKRQDSRHSLVAVEGFRGVTGVKYQLVLGASQHFLSPISEKRGVLMLSKRNPHRPSQAPFHALHARVKHAHLKLPAVQDPSWGI